MASASTDIVIAEPDAATRTKIAAVVGEAAAALDKSVTLHETTTGTSAFAACGEHRPILLIAEVLLEGLSGLSLLRRLEVESRTKTAVVFVTSLALDHDRYWALRNGAVAYFAKPFDAERLRHTVWRVLEEGPNTAAEPPAKI